MATTGVQVTVIVRVGTEAPSPCIEARCRRANIGDRPPRQPTPLTAPDRRVRPPRPSTPEGAALGQQTVISPRRTIPDDQGTPLRSHLISLHFAGIIPTPPPRTASTSTDHRSPPCEPTSPPCSTPPPSTSRPRPPAPPAPCR